MLIDVSGKMEIGLGTKNRLSAKMTTVLEKPTDELSTLRMISKI